MQVDSVALVRQVQGLACKLGDALEENERLELALGDAKDDSDDADHIREIIARELGGPIAGADDVEQAFAEARDELLGRPRRQGATIQEAGPGTLGRIIVDLPGADDVEEGSRGHQALVALYQIRAIVRNWGPLPSGPLPDDISPADIVVEVNEALDRARQTIVTPSIVTGGIG